MTLTREQILASYDLVAFFTSKGVELKGGGDKKTAKCPFHEDGSPSFWVSISKQMWKCEVGCGAGTIVDAIAKYEQRSPKDVFGELARQAEGKNGQPQSPIRTSAPTTTPTLAAQSVKAVEVAAYDYRNEFGELVYQAVRYEPKTFRQRVPQAGGKWSWSMDGVKRVLYRLPEVLKAETVWIVEGEKDADNLEWLGYCATCNVGGAGKWLDGYTENLAGKNIVICGDNDEPGQKHVKLVFDSIAGKVASTRIVKVPSPSKDVSDFIATFGTDDVAAIAALDKLLNASQIFTRGIDLPLYTLAEMEAQYIEYVRNVATQSLNLGNWIPTLGRYVRNLVPGELVVILGDTGTGKTGVLQNLAMKAAPLKTIMFELELPGPLMFERFVAINSGFACADVEDGYRKGDTLGPDALGRISHILTCTLSGLDVVAIESHIAKSELKFGEKPRLVLIDYVGLVGGVGKSRYEKLSNIAESLKVLAKNLNVIVVIASQIHRKEGEDPEIFLHDAKDSGSIENSAGLVLGMWRDPKDAGTLMIKILKNTKGRAGEIIPCNFNGSNMRITEQSRISHDDIPQPRNS